VAYRIEAGEDVQAALRRIACEQIENAVDAIDEDDRHTAVHEVRKRCKKLRGLVRLVRPVFPGYAAENAWFRDHARTLSELRDATSLLECCDALVAYFGDEVDTAPLHAIRDDLLQRREAVADDLDVGKRLDAVRAALVAGADRVDAWSLEALRKVYKRARKGMRRAREAPADPNLHEWRKRAKYHRYHLRLLREVWPPVMEPLQDAAKHLSDLLGDDHDLAVLRATLYAEDDRFEPRARELAAALIDRRRKELQTWSFPLGRRLLAESPKRFARRMENTWDAWRLEQQLAGALPKGSDAVT